MDADKEEIPSKGSGLWSLAIFFTIVAFLLIFGWIKTDGFRPIRAEYTGLHAKAVERAIEEFEQRYHGLPGDIKDASKIVKGCDSSCDQDGKNAGDGIIGDKDFAETLYPKKTPLNEIRLFWTHLRKAGLYSDPIMPPANVSYEVGYADGRKFPDALMPDNARMKGHVLIAYSDQVLKGQAKMTDAGKQPLTPSEAAQIDRKMDDGRANTGYVQAYGPRECFDLKRPEVRRYKDLKSYGYNEASRSRDCGLILLIAADEDFKLKKTEWELEVERKNAEKSRSRGAK